MNIYKKYIPSYWLPFIIAICCVAGEACCDLLGPAFMAHIINDGIGKQSLAAVYRWGGYMLSATICGASFAIARNIISSTVSQRFGADLRGDLFSKIIHFSTESSDQIEAGSLITRMTNDVAQEVNFVNSLMRIFFKAPLTCIGSMILAGMLNFKLSMIIYAVIGCISVLLIISMKLSYPRYAVLQKAMDALNTRLEEYLMGIRLVKAFGTYEREQEKFNSNNQTLYQKNVGAQLVITFMSPLLTLVSGAGTILILYFGSRLFMNGTVNPGEISAFVVYMTQILASLLMITNVFNNFVRTKTSTDRISEVMSLNDDFPVQQVASQIFSNLKSPLTVSFNEVSFSYPRTSGKPALKNVSFTVNGGQSLAIIGPTGSGKSTLAWLLIRLYDPTEGTICFNGIDIRDLCVDQVRKTVALVPQKPLLFSGSVRDTVAWGNNTADEQSIRHTLEIAGGDFIYSRKEGINTLLGSGGVNLSGGQKQRLSIARALIKHAPVLVLDDATSALDAITEAKVRSAILADQTDTTVIFITQRCSTAMAADMILVLEDGQCCGYGTHSDLLASCTVYRDIYDSQLGGLHHGGQ
jgi:ATP-binding cassette, subfamily B, multidrug efflux pump